MHLTTTDTPTAPAARRRRLVPLLVFALATPVAFAADWDAGENYLLRRGGEVVGYVRLVHAEGRSYLQDLQVVARHRGRGLGTQALAAIMAIARQLNAAHGLMNSQESRAPSGR